MSHLSSKIIPVSLYRLSSQVRAYANTDLLIGLHGAGITNLMFMPPGSMVFEITGLFDGRMTPLCGYHGPFAAVFGIHHYLYYFDWRIASPGNGNWRLLNDTGREMLGTAVVWNASAVAVESRHFYDSIVALTKR
jgi:hypothetical protein